MNNLENLENYVTIREASKISDRSEGAIRRRIQEGKLTCIKVGYSVLIPIKSVEELKKSKKES